MEEEQYSKTKLSIVGVLMALTLLSNFCSILALLRRKANGGKLTRMYFFLLHLFIADIIVAFSSLLPELIVDIVSGSHFAGGDFLCRLMKFIQMFGPYLSSYVLVMIAMDRFQAICYPMNNHFWQPSRSKQKILTAWIISIILCLPFSFIFKESNNATDHGGATCSPQLGDSPKGDWGARIYISWFTFSNFLVPLVALSFYYTKICSKIRRNLQAKKRMLPPNSTNGSHSNVATTNSLSAFNQQVPIRLSSGSSSTMEVSTTIPDFACGAVLRPRAHSLEGISRAKIRSVKQTVVVILGYIICSAPAIIIQLWKAWIDGEQHIDHCNEWYFWLMALNSIMNPWIYLSLNRDLQMSLFYCCCPCFNNEEKQKPTAAAMTLGKPAALHESLKTSSVNLLRPRSFTASQAAVAGQSDLLKTRPFSNRSFLRQTNSGNEIPLMRCRLNTFQL